MSNTPFAESLSADPVECERAIARKVQRVLNDTTLDRKQREVLVKKAQRELIAHRRQQSQQQSLRQQVAAMKLPRGYLRDANGGIAPVLTQHSNTVVAQLAH